MTTFAIYSYLFAVTTAYAVLLAWLKHLWEPDLTWLEVIIGVALCLAAPALDQRHNGPLTSEMYEQRVWLAFVVGGLPIVAWSIGKSVRARLQAEQRIRDHYDNTRHATDRPSPLADKSGAAQERDD